MSPVKKETTGKRCAARQAVDDITAPSTLFTSFYALFMEMHSNRSRSVVKCLQALPYC